MLNHQFNALPNRRRPPADGRLHDVGRLPGGELPHDLGKLILSPGETITGRVVDLKGAPLAGVSVQAQPTQNGSSAREVRTDASGKFRLTGVVGGYHLMASMQPKGDGPRPEVLHPIGPAYVQLMGDGRGATVELKELPSVAFEARIVDSLGMPARVGTVSLYGQVVQPRQDGGVRLASLLQLGTLLGQAPAPDQQVTRFQWNMAIQPDAAGRVIARLPKGLLNAQAHIQDESGAAAFMVRPKPGVEANFQTSVVLGVVKEDLPPVEFLAFRAANLNLKVVTEDTGQVPEQVNVGAEIRKNGRNWGGPAAERGASGSSD